MKAKQTNKNTVVGNFEEPVPRFRTPYTKNLITERCSSKSEDLVENATPSLSELVDKFNRGQRLTGVNYGINPNLVSKDIPDSECDEPDDVIPIRVRDIVEVEEIAQMHNERKKDFKERVEKLKENNQQNGSEQVSS